MAVNVEREYEDGPVASVQMDEKVTDPESDEAVQIPEGLDSDRDQLSVHEEPSPNDIAEMSAKKAREASVANVEESSAAKSDSETASE